MVRYTYKYTMFGYRAEWCMHPNQMLILVWNTTWPNPYIDTYTWLDTHTHTPLSIKIGTQQWQNDLVSLASFGQFWGGVGEGPKVDSRTDPNITVRFNSNTRTATTVQSFSSPENLRFWRTFFPDNLYSKSLSCIWLKMHDNGHNIQGGFNYFCTNI